MSKLQNVRAGSFSSQNSAKISAKAVDRELVYIYIYIVKLYINYICFYIFVDCCLYREYREYEEYREYCIFFQILYLLGP